ncbi:hypothetical protein [Corynebacterium sp. Marseille-P4321]|uniref:hypothetical protein n=1 Tax=Corynebacterium sp. Marseille-P4321 TaxID=2736603 RepID=UPI001588CB3B|nr:hypothetical protein [Corynebacterium sp. Marseille-P4321]
MSNQRPLPPEIYMRRRVAALVILLVVVALLVWGLTAWARSGGGDDGADGVSETTAEATAEQTPTSNPATEPTVPAPGEETETTETTGSSTATVTTQVTKSEDAEETAAAPARSGVCELKDLVVTAIPSQPSFPKGTQPMFYMEVQNPTDTDCEIDLDENLLRFEVYDMASNERIWADTDCYEPVATGSETFKAGDKRGWEARWSATASQPGQCSNRPAVEPGSYFLHAVIGDNASDASPFNIT